MSTWITFFSELGRLTLTSLWIPLLVWTLVALPFAVGLQMWRRGYPLVRYYGFLALLLALPLGLLMPGPPRPFGVPLLENEEGIESATAVDVVEPAPPVFSMGEDALPPTKAESSLLAEEGPGEALPVFLGLLTLLAIALALHRMFQLGCHAWALRRFRTELDTVSNAQAQKIWRDVADRLSLRRGVQLCIGPTRVAPMTFGWRRPVLVLPPEVLADHDLLRTVLLHEGIHIRRHDYAWGWIVRLLGAVFALHPGVAWLQRRIETHRELSCDAEVLFHDRLPADRYARMLLRFRPVASPVPVLSIAHPSLTLKHRILAMQNASLYTTPAAFRRVGLLLAALFLIVPALFVAACTPTTDESVALQPEDEIRRLEAQVAYLQDQIRNGEIELKHLREQEGAAAHLRVDYLTRKQRLELLSAMVMQRLETLETLKMEAATQEWMARLE